MTVRARRRIVWSKVFAFARAFAVLFIVAAVGLFGLARRAEAQLGEKLVGFGDELARFGEFRASSAPRRLTVNGLELNLLTFSAALDVSAVLDRLEASCRKHGGLEAPHTLLARAAEVRWLDSLLSGILRRESARRGVLACFDTAGKLDLSALTERLDAVKASGDLSKLGDFRYVLARREGHQTTVLVLWTHGGLALAGAFPKSGDAPGRDPENVPRAPEMRRLLSAKEHGAPYSIAVYEAGKKSFRGLVGWYDAEFSRGGWSVKRDDSKNVLVARRGDRVIAVCMSTTKDGMTAVSVVELS
jgi:hypothetical protein